MTAPALPFAGLELGGTKTICILGTGPGDVRERVVIPTRSPNETLKDAGEVLRRWRGEHDYAALGVTSFGPLDLDEASPTYGSISGTPKPDWSWTDVLGFARTLGVPTAIDTDVNGAALAEATWGAAQGLRSYAYVTVGTGLGVGTVVDGRTVVGIGHSEAGHMLPRRIDPDWAGCCPWHGDCVEGLASGAAIRARTGRWAHELSLDDPAWDEVVETLAQLFHTLVYVTAPQRILVGGGVIEGQPHLLPRIRARMIETMKGYDAAHRIESDMDRFLTPPALGDLVSPLGAIATARRALAAACG